MPKIAHFDDFLKLANIFHASIGVQPYDEPESNRGKGYLTRFIFYFGVINLNCMLVCELIYVFIAFYTGENILQAIMTMSYMGFVTVGETKMLFVWRQKTALTEFVNHLKKKFPQTQEKQKEYNIRKYLNQCTTVTVSFSLLYMILIWTYNLFEITQYLVYNQSQELPYTMYYLWNWRGNWSYYIMYFLQDLAGYTSAAGQISTDLTLCAFATQLIMHYDYVSQSLVSYEVKVNKSGVNGNRGYKEDMKFLKNIIEYHSDLLDLSDQMNRIFGLPLLLNFATSSIVICFVGFQMTIGASVDILIKLFMFLFSSIAQVYLICHYGQQLRDASANVANAAYNQSWPEADIRYQKMLVLVAKRAQKSAQLNATTFVPISRTTMTEIMQLSYKFFALLRTMYSTK